MSSRPTLTIASPILPEDMLARLAERFDFDPPLSGPLAPAVLVEKARHQNPVGVVVSVQNRLDADSIAALPGTVRIVASVSVGTDHIDLAAAAARGITVTNTPGVLDACNADLTWLLILGAARKAAEAMAYVRRGTALCPLLGTRVSGRTLGIWGMGRIGREVARRAKGFGMEVLYHNRRRLSPGDEQGATYCADRADFLARTQILTLHMPSNAETDGIIDASVFAALPEGAIFINAARGSLVDEAALFAALESGRLGGVGLDVYRNEPNIDPRFGTDLRVFAMPHMGSATHETRRAMSSLAIDNIEAFLATGQALTPVG